MALVACGGGANASKSEAEIPTTAASSAPSSTASTASTTAAGPSSTVATAPPAAPFCPAVGKITFEGGQGTSMEDAVRIVGAKGEMDGVASEYSCLDAAFGLRKSGAWKLLRQSLLGKDGKNYDLMSIQLADGTKKEILFDITAYFGKF